MSAGLASSKWYTGPAIAVRPGPPGMSGKSGDGPYGHHSSAGLAGGVWVRPVL